MAPPHKRSPTERVLHGTMAATLHAGTFGQMLEAVTEEPIPQSAPPRALNDYGRAMVQGYFAGRSQAEIRADEAWSDLSVDQHKRRSRAMCHAYGAQTTSHFVRRVVEIEGDELLSPGRIRHASQRELARKLSPREIVYWGLLSHGLSHPTIEGIFDATLRIVDRTIVRTKADLNLPHKTTEFVLAQFFADKVLKPEEKHLPHGYIVESLTAIRCAMHTIVVPPECLPEGEYPRLLDRY